MQDYTKSDYKKKGKELYDKLHLSSYPVAIKYIKSEDEVPRGYTRPSATGKKMSICQAFGMSRKWGMSYGITYKDNFCTPASLGHGWIPLSKEEMIESQVKQGWHKDIDAERRRAEKLYDKLEEIIKEGFCGLICAPLMKTRFIPDTILVFGNGGQIMHVIHALTFEHDEKYAINSAFEGYGESCGKGGLRPFLSKKPQIVVPGAGDRAFAGIQEHEIGIGFPGFHLFYIMDNLFKSGGPMNIGYPMRQLLPLELDENITPGFKWVKEKMEEMEEKKKGE